MMRAGLSVSRHDKANAHVYSQHLEQHAEGLHKANPPKVPPWMVVGLVRLREGQSVFFKDIVLEITSDLVDSPVLMLV